MALTWVITSVPAMAGYKWDEVEKSMMDGIYKALQSICILIIVGILIGVWINAGVVPTMIYYGLKVLKPAIFFIACVLICSITSLATLPVSTGLPLVWAFSFPYS